jgi:hypothetical protein
MTKRWSSTRSLDGQTKREASKTTRRQGKVDVLDMNEPDAGTWDEVKERLKLDRYCIHSNPHACTAPDCGCEKLFDHT